MQFRLDSADMFVSDGSPQACRISMGHVGLRWGMSVFDGACRSLMGMSSPIRHIGSAMPETSLVVNHSIYRMLATT